MAGPDLVGGPPEGPEVVRVALWQCQKCSESPVAGSELVGRLFGRAKNGQEIFRLGRKWSEGPPVGPEAIRKPSGRAEWGREALQNCRKWSGVLPAGP